MPCAIITKNQENLKFYSTPINNFESCFDGCNTYANTKDLSISNLQYISPLVIVHIYPSESSSIHNFSFEVMIIDTTIQTAITAKNTSVLTQISLLHYLN